MHRFEGDVEILKFNYQNIMIYGKNIKKLKILMVSMIKEEQECSKT